MSTPRSTCTAPKLFWMPRRLSSGLSDLVGAACSVAGTVTGISSAKGWVARADAARGWKVNRGPVPVGTGPRAKRRALLNAVLRACLRELVDADVCSLREPVVDDLLDLVLGHPHRDGE